MRGGPGTTCTLVVNDWAGPALEPGDFLRTKTGTCYRIDDVRPTRPGSRTVARLRCTRLIRDAVQLGESGVHPWYWSPR